MLRTRVRWWARVNGVLISTEQGEAVTYGLWYIEERGKLFITTGAKVYEGMIIGQNAKTTTWTSIR